MPVVGTGGHVDHGKSTLVQALTGRDPDRWAEEKERGLTIDLGFAWTELDGREVSFVDVPGHERYIKNMLAGTGGFDVALLAVAADEGWMPQSEEHLAVLDLLGVEHGVAVITKADRADPDLVELAALEAEEHLAGTTLEGCPVVAVSAVTGEGMAELRAALSEVLAAAPETADGRTRLWVDRVFPVSGAGTVVTGTLVGGPLSVGDSVEVLPGRLPGRVRSLQAHETERRTIAPGNRAAAGIAGLDRRLAARGSMLGRPGEWAPTRRFLAAVRSARYVKRPLSRRGAYQLHLGSGAWPVRLVTAGPIGEEETAAVLRTERPVPVQMGDRFVLRDVGRRLIAAGGRVLEPVAPRKGRGARRAASLLYPALDRSPARRAAALLEWRGSERPEVLAAHSGGGVPEGALEAGEEVMAAGCAARLAEEARRFTARFHADHPLRPGIPKASLASRLGVELGALDAVLDAADGLAPQGSMVAQEGFSPVLSGDDEAEWGRIKAALEQAGPLAPRLKELAVDPELLYALAREGRLVRVSEDLVYLPSQVEALVARLAELPPRFTVAAFRDLTGLTRKYAVPLLEWMDRAGITVRIGDERSIGASRGPAAEGGGAQTAASSCLRSDSVQPPQMP